MLHKAKSSNQSKSENGNDGLKLNNTYITNILKCVPPADKPLNKELNNCSKYFDLEISNLKRLKIIITLGKVAFDNCLKFYKKNNNIDKKFYFKHGKSYILQNNITLIHCYHPSTRNVQKKLISHFLLYNLLPYETVKFFNLIRFEKPIGFLLLMLPCWFALAQLSIINFKWYLLFFLGAFFMRGVGCIINDYFDRFLKAWSVSLPVAMLATSIMATMAQGFVDKITS